MKLLTGVQLFILVTISLLVVPLADGESQQKHTIIQIKEKLSWMEQEVKNNLQIGCSIRLRNLIAYIKTIWWPHIQQLSSSATRKEQQHILKHYNRLQYMLGMKKCESPYETFYQGKCYRIGSPGHPCPKYQQLYDNPADNTGYCYCQRNTEKLNGLLYIDGKCYMLNEQGPCKNGEWLTVKENIPICEQAPPGCPIDGQHIYWSCNDGNTICERHYRLANRMMKCSKLGSYQPACGQGARIFRNGMKSYCGSLKMVDLTEPNVAMAFPAGNRTCPLASGQQVKQETLLNLSNPNKPSRERPTSNRYNFKPCPTNYYLDMFDGRCKRLY